MARKRYQRGSLFLRGKKNQVWVGRWREDELTAGGQLRRVYRSETLGTLKEYPTRKLALRALEQRLAAVNDPRYRARPSCTFTGFADRWQSTVLVQHKPSTQAAMRSQLRRHLLPFFGRHQLRDIQTELIQQFVSTRKASPKTVRNLAAILRMLFRSARAWGYIACDPLVGVVLPKARRSFPFVFTLEELQRILGAAEEPYRTFYQLAAETGIRAGELCALRVEDLDLDRGLLYVRQSAWQGKLQTPKTECSVRTFALSSQLVVALRAYLERWRPNPARLLFATRNGTPWDGNEVVKGHLHPLLDRLGIEYRGRRCGLHAFRHANGSLMDRLGTPVKVRQQRLGHSDPRITLGTYTHVASEDDRRVAEQLGGILHPNAPKLAEERNTWVAKEQLVQ